jgi:hypothetical protein
MLAVLVIFIMAISLGSATLSYSVDAPKEVQIGKWFNVSVSIVSDKQDNVSVYSYVYRNLTCISQGWTANKKDISLEPGKQVNIVLQDMIKYNTEEGIYNLRVRLRNGTEVLNQTFPVTVHAETKVFEENYLYLMLVVISIIGLGLIFISRR